MGNMTTKLKKYFKILLLVILISIVIKAFAIDAFRIPSTSMENTLRPGPQTSRSHHLKNTGG